MGRHQHRNHATTGSGEPRLDEATDPAGSADGDTAPEPMTRAEARAAARAQSGASSRALSTRTVALLAAVALLLGGGVGAYAMSRVGDNATTSASGTGAADPCTSSPTTVAVAPEILAPVRSALARVTARSQCQRFDVVARRPDDVVGRIQRDAGPQIWVPDSSTRLDDLGAKSDAWSVKGSVAFSPVLVASPRRGAEALTSAPRSWSWLLNERGQVQLINPDIDSASRLAYFASRTSAPTRLDLSVAERLIFTSRFAKNTLGTVLDSAAKGTLQQPFPISEQTLATWSDDNPSRVTAFAPAAGTPSLDYPWAVSKNAAVDVQDAAKAAFVELRSARTRDALASAGFRPEVGQEGPVIGEAQVKPTPIKTPSGPQRAAALDQWNVLRKDMRMLAVMDVSGSMKYPATGTRALTRAQVTQRAAQTALKILPPGSQIGAWVFSTDQGPGGQPWNEMSSIDTLDSRRGQATHREELLAAVGTLPKRLEGDTALYDTTYAAYRRMTTTYDAAYVNSVVIMTDGRNDNPRGGLTLDQLLARIKAERDPQRPVRIITIGMGEADPAALQRIAAATGGTSYIANTPDDIQRVFVQALLARTATVD